MKKFVFERLKKKLRSTAGESLVEVLVSLLIAAMAILLLGQAVGVSVRMVRQSEDALEDYYTANNVLSARPGTAGDADVSMGEAEVVITWAGTGNSVSLGTDITVEYYVNQSAAGDVVISYGLKN